MEKSILFFHSHTSRGGTEHNILKISKELKDNGYKIHLCALADTGDLYIEISDILDSTTIIGDYRKNLIKTILTYRRLLQDMKPDYILNFGLRVELFSRVFSRIFVKTKVISNIRSTDAWRKPIHSFLDKITSFSVYKWVSNSMAGKEVFVNREKIDPFKTEVIYNFISFENDTKRIEKETIKNIAVLANIREAKGHLTLIEVAKKLKEKKEHFVFHLAGKDMMNGQLDHIIKKNGLEEYFKHLGFVNDTPSFLKSMDMFLLPSKWEGLPTSILEAMKYQIPVIASDVGGVSEIIEDGVNGFLVDSEKAVDIVNKILVLKDKNIRETFVENANITIQSKFEKKIIMNKWMDLLS